MPEVLFSNQTQRSFGSHPALEAISNYLQQSPHFRQKVPDHIDPDDFKSLFGPLILQHDEAEKRLLVGFTRLRNEYGRLSRVIETKLLSLLAATVDVLNNGHFLVLAMCARSIMEQGASLIYLADHARKKLERIATFKTFDEANSEADKLLTFFDEFMFGTKFFGEENRQKLGLSKAKHVNDMLKVGDGVAPGMIRNYEFLCDLVHPNFLGTSMVYCPESEEWSNEQEFDFQRQMVGQVLNTIDGTLRYLSLQSRELYWTFLFDCDHFFRMALHSPGQFDRVFEVSRFGFEGDGTSRDTAVHFFASSMKEHYLMLEQFISDRKLEGPGFPITTMEDGKYNYSCLSFSDSQIWVKVSKTLEFHRKSSPTGSSENAA